MRRWLPGLLSWMACGGAVVAPPAEVAVVPVASGAPSATPAPAEVPDAAASGRETDADLAGGESFGAAGLDLRTIGVDGGGRGEGIGLGRPGSGQGFSTGHRDGGAAMVPSAMVPSLRQGQTVVTGKLPPEVIQRIVRQNYGRFRLCYENGLRTNAKLAGKVVVRFVIDPSGAVTKSDPASDTDLPDAGVVSCVARGFANLSFPTPESGSVIVTYPVLFDPGS